MKLYAIISSLAIAAIGCGDNLAAPAPDSAVCVHCGDPHAQPDCLPGWERSAPDQPCHVIPHFPRADAGVITDAQ